LKESKSLEGWREGTEKKASHRDQNLQPELRDYIKQAGLEFVNDPKNMRYFEFGGGGRMVTFKLWKGQELIKIQVNYV